MDIGLIVLDDQHLDGPPYLNVPLSFLGPPDQKQHHPSPHSWIPGIAWCVLDRRRLIKIFMRTFQNHRAPANSLARVPHPDGAGGLFLQQTEQRSSNLDDERIHDRFQGARAISSRCFHRILRGAWDPSSSGWKREAKIEPPARQTAKWQKTRDRNEALDCRTYARAAAAVYGIDRFNDLSWKTLEGRLAELSRQVGQPPRPPERSRPTQRPIRGFFIPGNDSDKFRW
jgi:Phage terminase large subunit (GpA)